MLPYYENIIVAIDGSKEADYAFTKSLGIAKRNPGSKLYFVYIVDTRMYSAFEAYDALATKRTYDEITQIFDTYKQRAIELGIDNIELVIENGLPKIDITRRIAQRVNADLILCGATGHTKLERLLMGSVSEAIVRTANCDVLVVRHPELEA